jgi:hypothetical protein
LLDLGFLLFRRRGEMLEVECPALAPPPCAQETPSAAVFGGFDGGVDGDAAGVGVGVGVGEFESPKAAAAATVERKVPVKGKGGEKKKRRVMVGARMRPFPVLTEEQLAWFKDPVEREEWRELMARGARLYYGS